MSKSLYIVAIENSADHLGAELIGYIKKETPYIQCIGIGGAAMEAEGLRSLVDVSGLAILGFVEGLKSYPLIMKRVNETVTSILTNNPDAVVLIDSWGFMIRVAKRLKQRGFRGKIIKYLAPQVWAMREGRSKILASCVDHLLTIHSFDAPYFEKHGLVTTYVGNPVLDTDYFTGNASVLRQEYSIDADRLVLSVFFGSRMSEINTLVPTFSEALDKVRSEIEKVIILSPISNNIASELSAIAKKQAGLKDVIILPEHRKFDVFSASDMALACSGTITTQLACAGVPTVVAYKLNPVTYSFAKHLYKPDYISIVNIAAKKTLMPEYIQNEATVQNLSGALVEYLKDPELRTKTSKILINQTRIMRGKGGYASQRAAKAIANILSSAY